MLFVKYFETADVYKVAQNLTPRLLCPAALSQLKLSLGFPYFRNKVKNGNFQSNHPVKYLWKTLFVNSLLYIVSPTLGRNKE